MFNWVGQQFDALLANYVLGVVVALMRGLAPVALAATTLWVALYGWAVLRHEVPEPLPHFVWRLFKLGLVLALALQSALYINTVADSANALAMGVAANFLPRGTDPAALSSPYALLDKFNDDALVQIGDIMKDASLLRLDLLLAAGVFAIGTVVFLCVALFVVTLSKLLLAFVLAVGPVFLLCLAWRPTQRFFDSWLSMVLNTVVLTWFAYFALGLSAFVGAALFKAIADGGGFLGTTFNVLGESTRYCVLMVLMAILCFQAPALAAALTGGPAVQQGVQMVQNAMMVAGLRSGSAHAQAGRTAGNTQAGTAAGAAGGVLRRGGGLAQGAGRRTVAAVRTAAYRMAALRGRG